MNAIKSLLIVLMIGSIYCCSSSIDLNRLIKEKDDKKIDGFIRNNAPGEDAFVGVQRMAEKFLQEKKWEKATDIFKDYQPLFPNMNDRFKKIIDMLGSKQEKLEAKIICNFSYPENKIMPVPAADGKRIYLTGYESDNIDEDVFVTEFKNGKWQAPITIGNNINTEKNESILSISKDGNTIVLFGDYEGSFGNGDIFYSEKDISDWGEPKHYPKPINSKYFDSDGFLTLDDKAILFVSDRPGGVGDFHPKGISFHGGFLGNTDIYICIKTDKGWSDPINLGPAINTPFAERTPFLHPDGKTLYFSSDGHYSLGRLDVFKSTRLNDNSWTEWSNPVNIGKEVNTVGNDFGYKISTSGELAYFSTRKGDPNSNEEIYSITLPPPVRPQPVAKTTGKPVVTVKGRVIDASGNPLEANVKWVDLSTRIALGKIMSNYADGSFIIFLPIGKFYGIYVEKNGYFPIGQNLDLKDSLNNVNINFNVFRMNLIKTMKINDTSSIINNIFFDFDSYELKSESYPELNSLVDLLKEDTDSKVEISAHTDSIGTDEYNDKLSKNRAQSVVDYLISQKCDKKNLIPVGYGKRRPLMPNKTEEGRAVNRRVEFKYVKDTNK